MSQLPIPVIGYRHPAYLVYTTYIRIGPEGEQVETSRSFDGILAYVAAYYWQTHGDTMYIIEVSLLNVPRLIQAGEPDVTYLRIEDLGGFLGWASGEMYREVSRI